MSSALQTQIVDPLDQIIEHLADFSSDPLGFVIWAFPWGEPGTELEKFDGPEPWQVTILEMLGTGLIDTSEAVRLAVTSGHGVGKSALVAWIILWAMSTLPDTKGVVTANTEKQLKTKTWVELAKWHRMCLCRDLFKITATALFSADREYEDTWRFDMVPWSERNTEAFAGLHNQGKRILLIMDEASAIPAIIHEVSEGALTDLDTQIIWCMFGNPTQPDGRFREAFPGGRFAKRWRTLTVDSRTVSFTNKTLHKQWEDDYGEDSDFFRVRVKGEFPRVSADSFISYEVALEATRRELPLDEIAGWVLGVDVGRFGSDPSVIYPRRGRDGRSEPVRVFFGYDTMRLASEVVYEANRLNAHIVFIDGTGVGGGVVDRCRQLGLNVIDVQFGAKADGTNLEDRGVKYKNKRSEIWGGMRDWLRTGCINYNIPSGRELDETFPTELSNVQYGLNESGEIQLERKKDLKQRGLNSPNIADALACTFALPQLVPMGASSPSSMNTSGASYDDWDPMSQLETS